MTFSSIMYVSINHYFSEYFLYDVNVDQPEKLVTSKQDMTLSQHVCNMFRKHPHLMNLYCCRFQVFEEDATQEEVYTNALAEIPEKLMAGFNCTVIAYGQTGSGKTHTMMGANGASEGMLQHTKRMKAAAAANDPSIHSLQDGSSVSQSVAESLDGEQKVDGPIDPEDEGMIARTVAHLFDEMKKATPTTEFVVRCSYIEIYLEKVLDLLHPQGGESVSLTVENESDSAAGVGDNKVPNVRIAGAAELCCFDVSDVCALLARGNACRTMSATEMNTDSSRSHAIFVMRIEQMDRATNRTTFSTLHMIDLAGSELAANSGGGPRANTSSALQIEAKMINKSLTALQKMVQAQVENQRGAEIKLNATSRLSKLTRLLRPSFGGNCLTTIILTASPSSYNIGETISSIRFGQRCRKVMNQPAENTDVSAKIYRDKLAECEQKNTDALALIRTLAKKCQTLQVNSDVPATGPLWEMIESITAEDGGQPVDFTVSVRRRKDNGSSPFFEQNISTAPSGHSEKLHDRIEALEEELAMTAKAGASVGNYCAENPK
jgi:kinesin family member 5